MAHSQRVESNYPPPTTSRAERGLVARALSSAIGSLASDSPEKLRRLISFHLNDKFDPVKIPILLQLEVKITDFLRGGLEDV